MLLLMDPLSLAASVAGLASLALQIGPSLHEYFSDARDAPKDVTQYCNEIYGLFEVCEKLQDFLKVDAANAFEITESVLSRTVASCEDCLRKLAKMLDIPKKERHRASHWIKRIKWPIYKKQVEDIIARLVRYTQLFQFALTVEGWCVFIGLLDSKISFQYIHKNCTKCWLIERNSAILSRTPEDVTMVLKLQRDTCSKLHDITKGIAALKVSAEDYRSTADRMELVLGNVQFLADPSQRLSEIQESVRSIERQLTGMFHDFHDCAV